MFALSVALGFALSRKQFQAPWFFIEVFGFPLVLLGLTDIVVLYVANLYDHYLDFQRRENISQIILEVIRK